MKKSDKKNEGVGIASIIIIVILTTLGLYYFFSHRPLTAENTNIPLETPAPINNNWNDKAIHNT